MSRLSELDRFLDVATEHTNLEDDPEFDIGTLWTTWQEIKRYHEKNPSALDLGGDGD